MPEVRRQCLPQISGCRGGRVGVQVRLAMMRPVGIRRGRAGVGVDSRGRPHRPDPPPSRLPHHDARPLRPSTGWRGSPIRYDAIREGRGGGGQADEDESWLPATPGELQALSQSAPEYCSREPEFLRKKRDLGLPDVDWARYHIHVMFVDHSDTVRARMAAGLLQVISDWNHFGRAINSDRCGMAADNGRAMDPSTSAGLLARARPLGMQSYHFTRSLQTFEADDFHGYDLIIALDTDVEAMLLVEATREAQSETDSIYFRYLQRKIGLMSDFFGYCPDSRLEGKGPTSLLPEELLDVLQPRLQATQQQVEIIRPDLHSPHGIEEWDEMASSIVLGCACITQYLMDAFPDDMPHWDER